MITISSNFRLIMADMHGKSPKTLRQALLQQRQEFAAAEGYVQARDRLIAGLIEFLANNGKSLHSIALYWPIQDEVDLRPALINWAQNAPERRLSLPFARPDRHLAFYEWRDGDTLKLSKHGIPEPELNNPSRPQLTPDCILIPCVGWSSSAAYEKTHYWRLGYGGGYFDRTLAQQRKDNPSLICMGIAFDWQKLNDVQWATQTHDEPLDLMLTESGLLS